MPVAGATPTRRNPGPAAGSVAGVPPVPDRLTSVGRGLRVDPELASDEDIARYGVG